VAAEPIASQARIKKRKKKADAQKIYTTYGWKSSREASTWK
jgi:hypothetical protein